MFDSPFSTAVDWVGQRLQVQHGQCMTVELLQSTHVVEIEKTQRRAEVGERPYCSILEALYLMKAHC